MNPSPAAESSSGNDRLSTREYTGYALGDTASNFFFQTFNIFLTYYYVDVWGIPATVLLWLIPLVRAFGAFDDVIMEMWGADGALEATYNTPFGMIDEPGCVSGR